MWGWCKKEVLAKTHYRVATIFAFLLMSVPAQTGQNAPGSYASETSSWAYLSGMAQAPSVRRVDAEICLTEYNMTQELAGLGFSHIVLGENEGLHHLRAKVRFGTDGYEILMDRCTGQMQSASKMATPEVNG